MKLKEFFKIGESETAVGPEAAVPEGEDPRDTVMRLQRELKEAEAERQRRERELRSLEILWEKRLPAALSAVLMGSEGDMEEVAGEIRQIIDEAAEREILERCRTAAPETGRSVGLTPEDIRNTPVAELQRMRLHL